METCGDLEEFLRKEFKLGPACPLARSMTVERLEQTATFNASGTVRREDDLHYRYQFELDPACYTSLGAEDCDGLAKLWSYGPESAMSCTSLGVDCACQWDLQATLDTTESYSVMGSTLRATGFGPTEKMDFCADRDELLLWGSDASRAVEIGTLYIRD